MRCGLIPSQLGLAWACVLVKNTFIATIVYKSVQKAIHLEYQRRLSHLPRQPKRGVESIADEKKQNKKDEHSARVLVFKTGNDATGRERTFLIVMKLNTNCMKPR